MSKRKFGMAVKRIELTEDLITLIKGIRFENFTYGEKFDTSSFYDSIDDIDLFIDLLGKYLATDNLAERDARMYEKLAFNLTHVKYELEKNIEKLGRLSVERSHYLWGVDSWSLWGGNYILEDIARLLGKMDLMIPNTNDLVEGPRFPEDVEKYMYGLYDYIVDNLDYILQITLQFSDKGLTPGVYKAINYIGVWEKEE